MKENGESMNFIYLFLKGILMGVFMLVPGVSGGTIAILLKIYDELLIRLSNLFKDFKKNFIFLFIVLSGGIIGIFISSYFLSFVITSFYFEMIYIFVGILIYYIFETLCKNGRRNIIKNIILIIIGVFLGLSITLIPVNFFNIKNKYLNLFILGVFLASALILPGVSVSYVLLIFNIYDKVINAIKTFELIYLLEIGISLLIGIMIVVKELSYLLLRKKDIVENIISGFLITSIYIILPSLQTLKEVIYMMIMIIVGIILKITTNIRKR